MRLSSQLIAYLPRLRRYARAMCGSRSRGDTLVAATIRRLEISNIKARDDCLVELFQLLTSTWNTGLHERPTGLLPDTPAGPAVNDRLAALEPPARQAFLLVALEGFSTREAAEILQIQSEEFNRLYGSAEQELLDRTSAEVLIIEGDAIVSAALARIMEDIGHGVSKIACNRQHAIQLVAKQKPGLILCGICFPDNSHGNGAVNEITKGAPVPVVFIASNSDQLSSSSDKAPAFLISKSCSAEQIRAVTGRALIFKDQVPLPIEAPSIEL